MLLIISHINGTAYFRASKGLNKRSKIKRLKRLKATQKIIVINAADKFGHQRGEVIMHVQLNKIYQGEWRNL